MNNVIYNQMFKIIMIFIYCVSGIRASGIFHTRLRKTVRANLCHRIWTFRLKRTTILLFFDYFLLSYCCMRVRCTCDHFPFFYIIKSVIIMSFNYQLYNVKRNLQYYFTSVELKHKFHCKYTLHCIAFVSHINVKFKDVYTYYWNNSMSVCTVHSSRNGIQIHSPFWWH